MKKQYICPDVCVIKLLTSKSLLLTLSGGESGTMSINESEITNTSGVWTKENNSVWDEEW